MHSPAGMVLWMLAQGTSETSRNLWWVYLVLGVLLIAVLVLPRKLAKRSRLLDGPRTGRVRDEHELRRSMDRLLVELQETAREINATIDTKMIALKRLIDEADAQIQAMKELSAKREQLPEEQTDEPEPSEPSPPEPPLSLEARRRRELEEQIYRLTDEGKTVLEIARLTDVPRGEVELVLSLREKSNPPRTLGDA